jgi:hypothetical protein
MMVKLLRFIRLAHSRPNVTLTAVVKVPSLEALLYVIGYMEWFCI